MMVADNECRLIKASDVNSGINSPHAHKVPLRVFRNKGVAMVGS